MNNITQSIESLLKRLKVSPTAPDSGGRFKCPLCGKRTLFQVTNTPYVVCKSCDIRIDPIQMASKCMNITESEAEAMFQYGDLRGTFDPSVYDSQFGTNRKDFFSSQIDMLKFIGDGVDSLKNGGGILDIYMKGVSIGISKDKLPAGIGVLPPETFRPAFVKNMKLPESAVVLPYMLHGVVTHVDFVETVNGRTSTKTLIPTEHGIFPDTSNIESPVAYIAMSPKAALALHVKNLARTDIPLPLFHQKVQKVPLSWVKETVLLDCLEAPLDMHTAGQYFEISGKDNPIKVLSIRQPISSLRSISLDNTLNNRVDLLTWIATQFNNMYSNNDQATVYSLAHSIPMSSEQKDLLVARVKSLPKCSVDLVAMLTTAVNNGPSIVLGGRTIVVRKTSTDIIFPDRANLVNAGIYVKSGVSGKNYFGFDLSVHMANTEPLNVLVSLDDIRNETTLSDKILKTFMDKRGITRMPIFNKHQNVSWRVLIPRLAEGLPVLPLISKLGHLDNHVYFPNCGFNLSTGQMSLTDRGLAHDLPDHVTGYYAQLQDPPQDMTKLAEELFASKNPHDIGFTLIASHIFYGIVQSAIRTNFNPAHLIVTDREKEFWAPVVRIMHDSIHYDRRIPALPSTTGEMDRFMKHYAQLGTLPLPCRAMENCGTDISHLFDNIDMPMMIFSSDTVAARLSGMRNISYMSRPSWVVPSEKSVILSCHQVPELMSWLMKLSLTSRHKLTLCYTSTPASTMRDHICAQLGLPKGDYANKFNTQTYALFKYNSVHDMFAALQGILDAPTPLTERALLAYAGPIENLSENYIGLVTNNYIHLHKDRTIRILNSKNQIFNKRTIEEQLKLQNMLVPSYETISYPEFWSIARQVWDILVSPVCPQGMELQIREMLVATLQGSSTPEELWTTHSHYDSIETQIKHKPRRVAMN